MNLEEEFGLNPKEVVFVMSYSTHRNGSKAAREAGYSEKGAGAQANKLLKKTNVKAALASFLKESLDRYQITQDRVMEELASIGFFNAASAMRIVGVDRVIDITKLDDRQTAAIASIEQEEYMDGRGEDARDVKKTKLRFHPKVQALKTMAEILNMIDSPEDKKKGPAGNFKFTMVIGNGKPNADAELERGSKAIDAELDGRTGVFQTLGLPEAT